MKHLIITFLIAFTSTSAFASADCDFLTGNVFVCHFDGTSGLEIFENFKDSQILRTETAEDGSVMTEVSAPSLIGFDLDIKSCLTEAFENEAVATCFLNKSGYSTARPVPQKLSTARPTPQKTVIKRVDAR